MQAAEGKLIFGGCCRELMDHHPDVPIWTIHDSLLTVPGCEGLVRAVLLDNFARLGIVPTLNKEDYGEVAESLYIVNNISPVDNGIM